MPYGVLPRPIGLERLHTLPGMSARPGARAPIPAGESANFIIPFARNFFVKFGSWRGLAARQRVAMAGAIYATAVNTQGGGVRRPIAIAL